MTEVLSTGESAWIRALDNMHDGALFRSIRDLKTKEFRFDYVGKTWEKLTGISEQNSISDSNNVFVNILPDDFEILRQNIYESDGNRDKFNNEIRYLHPVSKKVRWLQISSYMRHETDCVVSNGFIFDVTARKEAEADLFVEKARLKALNDMPDGTLFRSARSHSSGILKFDYVSATWEKFTGVSPEDSLADMFNVFKYVPPEDLKILMQRIEESFGPLLKFDVEVRYNHPVYKAERWLHIWSYPRRDEQYTYSDGFIFDITERKHLELKYKKGKERLETLNDNLSDISIFSIENNVSTRQLRFSYISATCAQMIGLPADVVKNDITAVFAVIHPDDLGKVISEIERTTQTLENFSIEFRITKNNEIRWMNVSSQPRIIEDDLIVSEGVIRDITERKHYEIELAESKNKLEILVQERTEELVAANEELYTSNEELYKYQTQLEKLVMERTAELLSAKEKAEESDRLKSAFLANMSHEIRTPLNGILGIIQFMDNDDISRELRKEYMNIIEASGKQLTRIIEDVVDISKIESGQMTIKPVEVNLNDLMSEMRLLFEASLHANNKGHISLVLDDSGFIDNCVIYVDPVRLRQIIINLLGNAVKFTEKGYIRFGYRQSAPHMLEFVVEDTGIGIAESQREIIFERFRQAELGNNRIYGGSGLGLTISRSLVKLKGGDMWVKSEEGEGSSFYFTISV